MTPADRPAGLTGIIPVRNGNRLQYAWQVAVQSMLPVCEQVIVSDGESDDGTFEEATEWAMREPKLTVVRYPWDHPQGDHWFLSRWINWTIFNYAQFNMQCQLDADEAFDPCSYDWMRALVAKRQPAWFHRINLWRDPWTEAPHGTVCGERVVRMGPCEHPAVCDNLHPSEPWVYTNGASHPSLRIWHLGFLRDQQQFLKKAREIQRMLINTYDPNLAECERTGQSWVEKCPFPKERPLITHGLPLPEIILPWLRERGYKV